MNGVWIDKVHDRHPPKMITFSIMDSSVSFVPHGEQEGTAYNGHFELYLLPSAIPVQPVRYELGEIVPWRPPVTVHSADGVDGDVLEPVVMRYKERKVRLYFRGDAAFASPDVHILEYLERRGITRTSSKASKRTAEISSGTLPICLTRPVGRPPDHVRRFHASFSYQAGSWNKKRRDREPKWSGTPGELEFLASGFIVTNLSTPYQAGHGGVLRSHRGTAEQQHQAKLQVDAINWTRSVHVSKFRIECRSAPASRRWPGAIWRRTS